jgi:predicted ATPase with chaperone activity
VLSIFTGPENLGDVVDFFNGTRKFIPVKVDLLEIFASEANKIYSVAGKIDDHTALMTKRPFQSPHHTISDVIVINYVVNAFARI